MSVKGNWQVGVAGAIIHQEKVLLVHHTYSAKQGLWALPGGVATMNERLDESIVREITEEIGLHTKVVDLIGVVTRYNAQRGSVFAVFRLHLLGGSPVPDGVALLPRSLGLHL